MQIIKILSRFFICILCALSLCTSSFAANNLPMGDIGEYGNWITDANMEKFNQEMSQDATKFEQRFQQNVQFADFVPIEVKLGLTFMKALSAIDYVLQISLVRFTIIFLFVMYAFWIALEAYKMIRESADYKAVLYDIFKKGLIITIWIIILNYGPAKIFTMLITPVIALGTYLSDFILNAVAQTYNVDIPNTCQTIHQYVNANADNKLLIDSNAAANIMCLPARISVYFYHATGAAWKWMIDGFKIGHSVTEIVMGAVCIVLFIKCILKYAFMTLGIIADLFLKLLMLPFTALAEAMPETSEKNYAGQIFSGFLKVFHAEKVSGVIATFVDAAIYFVSLAVIIALCAALLTNIIPLSNSVPYTTGSAMTSILCGCLVLYFAGKAEELAKKIGGNIDNTFGNKLKDDTKTLWNDTKNIAGKIYKDWLKKGN